MCVCACRHHSRRALITGLEPLEMWPRQGGRAWITRALKATLRDVDFILRAGKIHWNSLSTRVTQSDMMVVSMSSSVQQTFMKHVLCFRHCARSRGQKSPWRSPCPTKAHGFHCAWGPATFWSLGSKAHPSIPQYIPRSAEATLSGAAVTW